jgi:hypothetical protein
MKLRSHLVSQYRPRKASLVKQKFKKPAKVSPSSPQHNEKAYNALLSAASPLLLNLKIEKTDHRSSHFPLSPLVSLQTDSTSYKLTIVSVLLSAPLPFPTTIVFAPPIKAGLVRFLAFFQGLDTKYQSRKSSTSPEHGLPTLPQGEGTSPLPQPRVAP